MSSSAPTELRKTPLHAVHLASGARMVEFAGWDMPVEYSGITDEHMAVRTRAGLFDVSHMGEIEVAGADALVARPVADDERRVAAGDRPGAILGAHDPRGTFVDDVLVYRLADDHYLLVVNAGEHRQGLGLDQEQAAAAGGDVALVNASARYALIASRAPKRRSITQQLTSVDLAGYQSTIGSRRGEVASVRATISRTGYTGEDGFELFVPPADAPRVWRALH